MLQQPQNGTGHAVQQLLEPLADFDGELLVLNGDVPLLREQTIAALLEQHRSSGAAVTLLTARLADPTGYGRVVADANGAVSAIVEHRDCDAEQRRINVVMIPEYAGRHWWDRILHNGNGKRLRETLLGRRNTVILDIPYRRDLE